MSELCHFVSKPTNIRHFEEFTIFIYHILVVVDADDDVGVGCGNCVLKIYTNDTGLPGYELCGEKKSYAGMTILSQYNRLRLKYVLRHVALPRRDSD